MLTRHKNQNREEVETVEESVNVVEVFRLKTPLRPRVA